MRSPLYILKLICRKVAQLVKQAWMLPETAAAIYRMRHRQTKMNDLEEERLDRIRHPWKYLGKGE